MLLAFALVPAFLGEAHFNAQSYSLNYACTPERRVLDYVRQTGASADDLNLPVRIVVCPTVREADGLALSSRNARLSAVDRERALALSRGLRAAERCADGERDTARLLDAAGGAIASSGLTPEYLVAVDPDTLLPVERAGEPTLIALAARVGDTLLIDNVLLVTPAAGRSDGRRRTLIAAGHRRGRGTEDPAGSRMAAVGSPDPTPHLT